MEFSKILHSVYPSVFAKSTRQRIAQRSGLRNAKKNLWIFWKTYDKIKEKCDRGNAANVSECYGWSSFGYKNRLRRLRRLFFCSFTFWGKRVLQQLRLRRTRDNSRPQCRASNPLQTSSNSDSARFATFGRVWRATASTFGGFLRFRSHGSFLGNQLIFSAVHRAFWSVSWTLCGQFCW